MENDKVLPDLQPADFHKIVDGRETSLRVLTNSRGARLAVTNYGAKIVSLAVPDRNGRLTDVVTGHASIDDYLASEEPYFGAVCGRYANRIARGRFMLDGTVYDRLPCNNGPNCLHGGMRGFHAAVWEMKQTADGAVELTLVSPDGDEGFPGMLTATVSYTLTDANGLVISYRAVSDRPTVVNLTNHSYFNLSGAGEPTVCDHLLTLYADRYLPTDDTSIPLGPGAAVAGTPMDFRRQCEVGARIGEAFEQLALAHGYDHTYIINRTDGSAVVAARCVSPRTGIAMDVYTTEPGVQLYTGNWMTGRLAGKHGQRYPQHSALCLETQHFPDSPNRPEYPSTVLRPGGEFRSMTMYQFSVAQ
ncbi:MAG: galactose mutarotase [Tannerella sp.]|jgi:aldose 1-epimerase|nr:galactose mutarotase [Tannerella sp.]